MRGRVAMLIEDMVVVGRAVEGTDLSRMTGRNANQNNRTKGVTDTSCQQQSRIASPGLGGTLRMRLYLEVCRINS